MKKILSLLIVCVLSLVSFSITFWEGGNSCTTQEIPNAGNLLYSPDGKIYAYLLIKDNGKQVVVDNWIESKEYTKVKKIQLSPNNKKIIYFAIKDNGKNVFVIDWIEGKEYNSIDEYSLKYSPNNKSFAYIAVKDNGKQLLVRDWIDGKEYNSIDDITYSPDSKSIYYHADGWVIKDGIKMKQNILVELYNNNLKYSLDFKSNYYISTKDNGKQVVVKDWVEGKEYASISIHDIKYSPDSKSFLYVAKKDNSKWVLVKDWIEGKEYSDIMESIYSPDSKSFAYIATKDDGKQVLVKDWIEGKEYKFLIYSIRSIYYHKSIDYFKGSLKYILVGKNKEYNKVEELQYLPDSKSFSYIAKQDNGKIVLVKDWVESKEYIGLAYWKYSSDSKSSTYILEKDNGKMVLIKDWVESEEYIGIHGLTYTSNSNILYIARKGNNDYLIKKICNLNSKIQKNSNLQSKRVLQTNTLQINKTVPQFFKQLILSKKNLNKTFKWRKNIKTIDLISEKLSKQKLERLMEKLQKIDTSLVKFRKYKDMLDYLEANVWLKLIKFNGELSKCNSSNLVNIINKGNLDIKIFDNRKIWNDYYVSYSKVKDINIYNNFVPESVDIYLTKISCLTWKNTVLYRKKGPSALSTWNDYIFNKINIVWVTNNKILFSTDEEWWKYVFRSNYLYDFSLNKTIKLNNNWFTKKIIIWDKWIYVLYRFPWVNNKLILITKDNKERILYEDKEWSLSIDKPLPKDYLRLDNFELSNNTIKLILINSKLETIKRSIN